MNLRHDGTDFGIRVMCPRHLQNDLEAVDFTKTFVDEYIKEHGFNSPSRGIGIDDVRVGVMRAAQNDDILLKAVFLLSVSKNGKGKVKRYVADTSPATSSLCYYRNEGRWRQMNIWKINNPPRGKAVLPTPCMIVDSEVGNTVVIDLNCIARVASDGNILLDVSLLEFSEDGVVAV